MYTQKYLHFGLGRPRYGVRERVCGRLRLGEEVRIELVLVLVFEDLVKTKQADERQIPDLVSHAGSRRSNV